MIETGNVAEMRSALEEQLRYWNTHVRTRNEEDMRMRTEAALVSPPRNCDIGTVKEQTERFESFCQSNMQFCRDMFGHDDEGRLDGWDCREDCPVGRMIDAGEAVSDRCQLAWAQMPYEGEGKK